MLRTSSQIFNTKKALSLKALWTEIVNKPRLVDSLGELPFDGAFWQKNIAVTNAISCDRGNSHAPRRVCVLTENDRQFLTAILASWLSGSSAVPLCSSHPLPQIQYYVEDSGADVVLTDMKNKSLARKLSQDLDDPAKLRVVVVEECKPVSAAQFFEKSGGQLFKIGENSEGLILYTSGTTGKPKGVSLSMKAIATQIEAQAKAWEWSSRDVVLHTLPLYHTHGLVNAFLTPLFHGGSVVLRPKFHEEEVFKYLSGEITTDRGAVTVFTGVPTMYAKLLDYMSRAGIQNVKEKLKNVRLLMSGSAPLSETLAKRWTDFTGIQLLERYGCTETGMVLTNPLRGPRNVGYVGMPFQSVDVRLVHSHTGNVILTADGSGVKYFNENEVDDFAELQVGGASIFDKYINREKETSEALIIDSDGSRWYRTGDCVSYSKELNSFKINGRASADIIKTGGFKISALDVETKISEHPNIQECAVVGVPDEKWGECVALVAQLKTSADNFNLTTLRTWGKARMPAYWIPTKLVVVDHPIPRNQMGKINKKELRKTFFA